MLIEFDDRTSTSPLVERIWRSHSRLGGSFLAMADSRIELVFTRLPGIRAATLRGPSSRGSLVECPPNGEWLAIRFRLGLFLPALPAAAIADRAFDLPLMGEGGFGLLGERFEIPTFDNAEGLVERLVARGLIALSGVADPVAADDLDWMRTRRAQRHFRRATGFTFGGHRQVEQARHAATMLAGGASILDTVFEAGYFDQPHLTRSVGRLVGMTPAKIARERPQLSFLCKTAAN